MTSNFRRLPPLSGDSISGDSPPSGQSGVSPQILSTSGDSLQSGDSLRDFPPPATSSTPPDFLHSSL
ncbi:OLC1v1008625C1, partial [Oldenlandia corymbosa var. corymbosa]